MFWKTYASSKNIENKKGINLLLCIFKRSFALNIFSGDIPSPQDCVFMRLNQQQRRGGGGAGIQTENQQNSHGEDTMAASMPITSMMGNNKGTPSKVLSLSSSDRDAVEETTKRWRQREFCPCCCCSETLMKFQVCSRFYILRFFTR